MDEDCKGFIHVANHGSAVTAGPAKMHRIIPGALSCKNTGKESDRTVEDSRHTKFWGWNQPIHYDTVSRFGLKLKTDVYMRSSILSTYYIVIVLYLFEHDFFLAHIAAYQCPSMTYNKKE